MKKITSRHTLTYSGLLLLVALLAGSCSKDLLKEKPKDFFSTDNAFTDPKTFQLAVNTLYADARTFIFSGSDGQSGGYPYREYLRMGTDVATCGQSHRPYLLVDFSLLNTTHDAAADFWNAAYSALIPHANVVIDRAQLPAAIWDNDQQKNEVIAQARFFRAYAYYTLLNLYGDVPLVDHEILTPQFDFTRAPKDSVLEFVREDLEFASRWLPANPDQVAEGTLTRSAADMLLSTAYLQLDMPDSTIAAATRIINSGYYHLMTARFGSDATHDGHFPEGGGDVFSDLFWDNNANRSGGNMESIWVLQGAYNVPGGDIGTSLSRTWGPYYANLIAPNGGQAMTLADSLGGRPVGYVRTTNYFNYTIWDGDWNDMRNSPWNIRRTWYYNNPSNALFGKQIDFKAPGLKDTIQNIYPMVRKAEGSIKSINSSSTPDQKFIVYRLAETFLLRAEAYLDKGQLQDAADDINVVRARAHAPLTDAGKVNLDFILDERARELIIEEPRRITLNRLGLWYDRTLKYSLNEPAFYYLIKKTIKPYNALLPIPQSALDITPGLKQNSGY
ncbi:RagB/SusD family nutrient uptake outer membrane protein [Compostibacter hankyongensis]|uniref:RagB/SusD family nutrient uptake outer membrane protein n=1 Tax=Compostibacter hankyongensis TaxID=1007089 RepID=A0ABP8FSN4_9BACT